MATSTSPGNAGYSSTPSAFAKPPAGAIQYNTPPKPPQQDYQPQEQPARRGTPLLSKIAIVLAVISILANAYMFMTVLSIK
ncbi:MAG TPA: hypothetical protein PLO51_03420, partial [Candidatus Micrarchaeota archaeon]|nr:hypothetical protein [Candidatus Micrarchaeota archaeon]